MISYIAATILPLIIGWILDRIFGDPERLPHPVVWFGKIIAVGERALNRGRWRTVKGGLWALFCILSVFFITDLILSVSVISPMYLFANFGMEHSETAQFIKSAGITPNETFKSFPLLIPYIAVSSILIFYCLAGTTLAKEVRNTFKAVDRSLEEGRIQVGRIVGRNTSKLDKQEIRTAALETLAENLSDGVIAPLFWYFLLGVPGMMAYKMVNTLDSMIGYKTERYKKFGCVAARIDDIANYVPARLTALLMTATLIFPYIRKHSARKANELLRFIATYGPKHASPNSGWPEAALAGILNCRFGGSHVYFGEMVYKPFIGNNNRELSTDDMEFSLKITRTAETIMIISVIILNLIPVLIL
ncbi:MAG: cobalamin biosynthesis protein CobD [Bacteroides sp. 43_108]|mgnify:FL=1|nr:MAG: cobalamin biosynthesis protein CobD [Bacteroides sp. 43_108]